MSRTAKLGVCRLTAVTLFVVGTLAQCVEMPPSEMFSGSACVVVRGCQEAFCACVGAESSNRSSLTCLSTTSAGCSTIETCLRTYTKCFVAVESQRSSADKVCAQTGDAVHAAVLQAVVTSYAGSALQTSCRYHVCNVMNSSRLTCNFGTNASNVCVAPDLTSSVAIRVVFKLSGSSWGLLLNNGPRRTQLEVGLRADIARLLNVTIDYIVIFNLTEGSLIVDFAVLTGSPASQAQLEAAVRSSAANTSWLTTTKSVYSIVSNETITVQSVVLSAGGTTSAPNTSAVISPQTPITTNSSGTTPPATLPLKPSTFSSARDHPITSAMAFAALLLWHVAV
jgi:hypothetical protein